MLGGSLDRRLGAIAIGSCARYVLGGPEIYTVARIALTAGLPGKRTEKILDVRLAVWGLFARLCSLSDSTRGQF